MALPTTTLRVESLLKDDAMKKRFEEVLGKRAPSFISSVISATKANKMLAECEPMSVISSAMIAATLDLPIVASLGFAHIVPYREKGIAVAQFQIGWKGLYQLAMRTGQYKTINPTKIYEGQLKAWNSFTGEMEFQEERLSDKVVGYLLYFRLINGFEKYVYWTRERCEAHGKRYSKAYAKGFGPWKDDFDAMALKTVVKDGLSKYGILSVEMQRAIVTDQGTVSELDGEPTYLDNDLGGEVEASRDATSAPVKKQSRLAKAIAATNLAAIPQENREQSEGASTNNEAVGAPPAPQNQQSDSQAESSEPSIAQLNPDELLPFEPGYQGTPSVDAPQQ